MYYVYITYLLLVWRWLWNGIGEREIARVKKKLLQIDQTRLQASQSRIHLQDLHHFNNKKILTDSFHPLPHEKKEWICHTTNVMLLNHPSHSHQWITWIKAEYAILQIEMLSNHIRPISSKNHMEKGWTCHTTNRNAIKSHLYHSHLTITC